MPFSITQLKPVGMLSHRFGWKGIVYGGPGTGKTPLMMSCPAPVHAFVEAGLSSVRKVMDQPGVVLRTGAEMLDYVKWCVQSNESRQFQTKTFDSYSEMAQVILDEEKKKTAHGQKAYGQMAEKMMEMMQLLFLAPDTHVLGIAKETLLEIEGEGKKYRPLFPGQMLDAAIPHLFDSIWRLELVSDGKGGLVRSMRTKPTFNSFARERTGNLNELEYPDMTALIAKAML